jgi:hypothetical protein
VIGADDFALRKVILSLTANHGCGLGICGEDSVADAALRGVA